MITLGQTAKAVVVFLSVAMTPSAFAQLPNVRATTPTAVHPPPALPYFGLNMGATGPALDGLSGFLSSMRKLAIARTCVNRCPPSSWSVADPSLAARGKMTAASLALGAGGAGLAIGQIALRGKREPTRSWVRKLLRSLTVKPAPGGVGLSFSF